MADSQSSQRLDDSAATRYQQLLQASEQRLGQLRARDGSYAMVRLVLFAAALLVLSFAFFAEAGIVVWLVGAALFVAFLIAAILNEPVRDAMLQEQESTKVTKRLIARLQRDWDALEWSAARKQLKTVELAEHQKDVADDLDLLGKSSLFQFVSMAGTTIGVRTLARWLTGTADAEIAVDRSAAIKRLAPRREQRFRFYSLASHVGSGTGDPDEFIRWTQGESWLDKNRWVLSLANLTAVLAALALVVLVASRFGVVPTLVAQIALAVLVIIMLTNMVITSVMLGPVHQIFSVAMSSRDSVDQYRELFSAAEWLKDDQVPAVELAGRKPGGRLQHLQDVLLDDPTHSARQGMNALQHVATLGALRSSASTFLLYLPLQAFALWDVRVLAKLEQWQREYRDSVPGWFDAFGELEALMSLAAVCDENPTWVFPSWSTESSSGNFRSTGLGHPLLSDSARVCNDVSIGPAGTVLLVTGSNMSGKSTMLRSVGLNVALAGAGSPVCATQLELPSIELATSIRVRDNLAEGVSFYMAELQRLKGVVDRARALADDPHRVSLFLLDEILQGTNSRERQIAVTQVLRHLIDCGAIGAISTHDLELADEPELQAVSEIVHFRETIHPDADGHEQMTFDYQMRQGVSPTTNALRLLEIVGL
ncbi:MutS family DNA mismatch repair protein [Stieleria sp. TO1_6]|uniref:MutS family DNA mismatch repair protein n=1 Tax=Stieleria tagensis TaxID=2956795 RepID=UPI00209B4656|nr:MutS family DNA mismatch repair protein [Stieleria tagensis]MCO8123868.1 MutS family DNA mismatch repair protein [Stieleria tagensis]